MANNMTGGLDALGFTNKARVTLAGSNTSTAIGTISNYDDISSLRTALAAANGAYYTSALLDKLSVNDMVYALRCINNGTASNGSI